MTRNLKALGLALVAAFAMSAVMASAASANHLEMAFVATGEPHVTLSGNDDDNVNKFTTTAGTTHCTTASYSGTIAANDTPTEVKIAASYSGCEVTPFGHATVNMNGCEYGFFDATTVNSKIEAKVGVTCPVGQEITVTATIAGTTKCTLHIGEANNQNLGTITLTNVGSGTTEEVTADLNLSGIHYTHTTGTGFGHCSAGTGNNGTFEGLARVTATNANNEHVGVAVTHHQTHG